MNIALIQARENSNRLPKKVLLPLQNSTVLEHVHKRVSLATMVDKIVIVTGNHVNNKNIINLCLENDFLYFSGSDEDVLNRYVEAANEFDCKEEDNIIRITADCPLIDPFIIDQTIRLHLDSNADYTSNTLHEQYPDGMDCEVTKFRVLKHAEQFATVAMYREHVTKFIYDNSQQFKISQLTPEITYPEMRLTLDHAEDYELIQYIMTTLSKVKPYFSLDDIVELYFKDDKPFKMNINIIRNEGLAITQSTAEFVKSSFERIVLGTANLGMSYGVANQSGEQDLSNFRDIIKLSKKNGISMIDTAYGYGNAEYKLGLLSDDIDEHFEIYSKVNSHSKSSLTKSQEIESQVHESLGRLNQNSIYCYYLHDPEDMYVNEVLDKLIELKSNGLFEKIGVSVYTKQHAMDALEIGQVDVIQVKYNLLDRELEEIGFFERAESLNKEIMIRSVFLQGVLINQKVINDKFATLNQTISEIDMISRDYSLTRMDLALFYVLSNKHIKGIILGFDNLEQFEEIISSIKRIKPNDSLLDKLKSLKLDFDKKILNPTNW
jgi:spore coat polysaccharide biosynthesis protein SpsF